MSKVSDVASSKRGIPKSRMSGISGLPKLPNSRRNSTILNPSLSKNVSPAKKSLLPNRRQTSRTMIEKVVEKTFGEQNKDVIFQKY